MIWPVALVVQCSAVHCCSCANSRHASTSIDQGCPGQRVLLPNRAVVTTKKRSEPFERYWLLLVWHRFCGRETAQSHLEVCCVAAMRSTVYKTVPSTGRARRGSVDSRGRRSIPQGGTGFDAVLHSRLRIGGIPVDWKESAGSSSKCYEYAYAQRRGGTITHASHCIDQTNHVDC
jgi:hypothetical protein